MIIFRYLAKEIYATLLATSVILLLVFMSNQFIRYLKYAAEGRLTAHTVLLIMSLKMPDLLALMLPLAFFLSIMLVYGRLYADNEITVMFACGVSKAKLVRFTLCFAAVVALIVTVLMFWVGPHFNRYADNLLNKGALSPLELVQPDRFMEVKKGQWVFYVGNVSRDHKHLYNIFAAEQPEALLHGKKSLGIITAERGDEYFDKATGDTFLVLKNGNRYVGVVGQRDYKIINFKQYGVRIQENKAGALKADSTPTMMLFTEHRDGMANAELQWRFAVPIMVLILTLIALPLSHVKTRQARYVQLVPAMLLYIIYGNFIFLTRTWLREGSTSPWLGTWWVHLLMLGIACSLLLREFGWQRLKLFVVQTLQIRKKLAEN